MEILKEFESYLKANQLKCPSFHPYFEEALNYALNAGGKHFRAQLLLGVVCALDKAKFKDALPIAKALEMVHTYSLIHDDLPAMDNAPLRRGLATTHIKYDEVSAILAGDGLNTDAFWVISQSNLSAEIRIKCVEILSHNAGSKGMVLGQAIDCYFEDKPLNQQELEFLHLHKTGALIAGSIALGAVIAGASDEKMQNLYNIGLKLGLVFQIHDDIIDFAGDEAKEGKKLGADEHKNSFVKLLGLGGAREYKEKIIGEILHEINECEPRLNELFSNLINKYLKG